MVRVLLGLAAIVAWIAFAGNLLAAEPAAPSAPAGSSDSPAAATSIGITRADLAASYLRLEQAYFANPPAGDRAAATNRAFDRATLAFFTGRSGQAIEQIDAQTESLLVPPATTADRAAASLKAVVEPAVLSLANPTPASVRVVSLYEPPLTVQEDVSMQLAAVRGDGQIVWQAPLNVRCGPDAPVDVTLPIAVDPDKLIPGLYRLELGADNGRKLVVGRFNVVAGPSLDEQRQAIAARLEKVTAATPQLVQALATCKARNALLSDEPSPANSAQFLADLNLLAQQVAAETDALEAGRDPYLRRAGDYWRVLVAGGGEIPLRVYAPKAVVQESPRPLLVVLHGAGGDENMFPEAYGAGIIKRIADEHGLLIASPSTYRFGSNPQRLGELIESLSYDYAIDRKRIYVLGHSMGAGAVAGLIRGQAPTIAAACCIAGGNNFQSPNGIPPLLVLLAEFDGVVPVKSVQAAAERAQQAKFPVELRIVPDYGHTLVVGHELGSAVEWLLKHQQP